MADKGNAQGLGGGSVVVPLGKGSASSNEWLGIKSEVAKGTNGSRPDSSARYGGDKTGGELFKGKSVAKDSKEMNSGGGEKPSKASGQYGPGGQAEGSMASRQNMTIAGDQNTGKLVGKGANATPKANAASEYGSKLKNQLGADLEEGTADQSKNMKRALKGIGGKGNKQA